MARFTALVATLFLTLASGCVLAGAFPNAQVGIGGTFGVGDPRLTVRGSIRPSEWASRPTWRTPLDVDVGVEYLETTRQRRDEWRFFLAAQANIPGLRLAPDVDALVAFGAEVQWRFADGQPAFLLVTQVGLGSRVFSSDDGEKREDDWSTTQWAYAAHGSIDGTVRIAGGWDSSTGAPIGFIGGALKLPAVAGAFVWAPCRGSCNL